MARPSILRRIVSDYFRRTTPALHRPEPETWREDELTGACLGHSTVLLNLWGTWVLTDPVFSARVGLGLGPLVVGPKRYLRPALRIRDLPKIDLILLSHAHFDHLDLPSLRRFPAETVVVTARATADLLGHFRNVHELDWTKSIELPLGNGRLKLTALEVNHWGARMMKDDYRGYNGYLMEKNGRRICFGGDTADTRAFAKLRAEGLSPELICLPIGAYDPWIRSHCTPEQAATMAAEAGAETFVPLHHETFQLSSEPMTEPAERIVEAFRETPERLLAVHVGETFRLPEKTRGV